MAARHRYDPFCFGVSPHCHLFGPGSCRHSPRDSVRAGLALTPLGEFSFVIAQLGVSTGAIPATFYPMAVGASLFTTLLAPSIMRRSDAISASVDRRMPLFLREWISFYDSWLKRIAVRQQRSILWKLTGRRIAQTTIQVLFVSALMLFVAPAYRRVEAALGRDLLFPNGLPILFWSVYGLLLLAPLVAIWRNFEALAMIFAESATRGSARQRALRPLLQSLLKSVATALLIVWLLVLLPFGASLLWVSLAVLGILGLLAAIFWRRLVLWHSRVEIELRTQLATALGADAGGSLALALQEQQSDWALQAEEFTIPDFAACAGQNVGALALRKRFGCSIASIDRQGFVISNPAASEVLYPRDVLLLIGSADQIDQAIADLNTTKIADGTNEMEEQSLEVVSVPAGSPRAGRSLMELDPIRALGVQIAGIQRNGSRTLTPSGADRIQAGDELLVLGTPRQIHDLREWLNPLDETALPAESTLPPK